MTYRERGRRPFLKDCFHLESRKAYLGFNVPLEFSGGIFCFFAELAYFCTLFNQISFSTMKQIDVGRGMFALVDDCDYPELSKHKWTAYRRKQTFYVLRSEKGKTVSMHRQILGLKNRNDFCDHVDGNGLNNQRQNLRVCSLHENNLNKRGYKNNEQGFKGVKQVSKRRYMARITHSGKIAYLGTFDCPQKAAQAYNEKAKELHGAFARLNDI